MSQNNALHAAKNRIHITSTMSEKTDVNLTTGGEKQYRLIYLNVCSDRATANNYEYCWYLIFDCRIYIILSRCCVVSQLKHFKKS